MQNIRIISSLVNTILSKTVFSSILAAQGRACLDLVYTPAPAADSVFLPPAELLLALGRAAEKVFLTLCQEEERVQGIA